VGIKACQKKYPSIARDSNETASSSSSSSSSRRGGDHNFHNFLYDARSSNNNNGNNNNSNSHSPPGNYQRREGDGDGDGDGDGHYDEDGNEYEPNWRDQIYYWTGFLSFDSLNSCLLWKGSWLGSFVGKPNPEEFSWSSNEFEYSGEMLGLEDLYVHGLLRPRSGYFKGYYMMDNDGSGSLDKYLDNEYYVEFEEVRGLQPPRYTVVGKGDSDFGTFVLTGTYNAGNRVLEMARQYISEEDERCSMDVNQLKLHLIAAAAAMS
jgi:hypothetical protein